MQGGIQEVCEKLDLTPARGRGEFTEMWESPNRMIETGTLEMEAEDGAVLITQVVRRTEFVRHRLDISRQAPQGKVA